MPEAITLRAPAAVDARPPADPEAYALEAALRSLVHIGAINSARSKQRAIGASQAGDICRRKLAFKMAGTRPSNVPDPLRALVGSGVHLALAQLVEQLDGGAGRFLTEAAVRYRGVPGTVDVFDRLTGTVVDWKTTTLAKIRHVQQSGPPAAYVTQLQIYGAALAAAGENVRALALAYLPTDSTLDELWVWRTTPDQRVADDAVNGINALVGAELETVAALDPSAVEATPSHLCPWCPYHKPGVTSSATSCPGQTEGMGHGNKA